MDKRTKRCNFDFPFETIELLDKKKIELGFGNRTSTIKHLIHNSNGDTNGHVKNRDYILSSTMIFCVGVLRANVVLEILGGAFMILLFARSTRP